MTKNTHYYKEAYSSIHTNDFMSFVSHLDYFNLEERDSDKQTILWHAVSAGKIDFVRELLKRGSDVNASDSKGWTPLHVAAQNYNVNIVELLIEFGADIEAQNKYGNNVIWVATFYANGRHDVIEQLLCSGADPTKKNKNGASALDVAILIANYDNRSVYKKHGYL